MRSIPEVLGVEVRPFCNMPLEAGDLVQIGVNSGPTYRIVHIADGHAWIRPLTNGQEGITPLDRLRKVS